MDAENFRSQQTIFVLINIGVLAALFFVHIAFLYEIGAPTKILLGTLALRFVILIGELGWLQSSEADISERAMKGYTRLSIWLNIVFAFTAASFGGIADSHYSVLMIIPIVQAAYSLTLPRTVAIAAAASMLTVLEVWIFYQQHPPVDLGEFFEAATVSLIFFVVAIVVALLVGNLRQRQAELRESLETLERTQKKLVDEEKLAAVGRLSGAIAHEIRNPIALIASSLEVAMKQPEGSAVRGEMIDILTAESKKLETLTGDFLDFARLRQPKLSRNSALETIERVAAMTRAYAAERGVKVEGQSANGAELDFDPDQITQALVNLVMNAIDSAADGGVVRLGFTPPATFHVANSGSAIGDEHVARLFEPFFTTKAKGTGLGLAIVRSIARAHGGDVLLGSNSDGNVRFEIKLEAHGEDSDR